MSGQTTPNRRMTRSLYIRSLIIGPTYDADFWAHKHGSLAVCAAAPARNDRVHPAFDTTAFRADEHHSVCSN
jgi:hypothetical protein